MKYWDVAGLIAYLTADLFYLYMLILLLKRPLRKKVISGGISGARWIITFMIPVGSIFISTILYMEKNNTYLAASCIVVLLAINGTSYYLYSIANRYYEEKNERSLIREQNKAYINQFSINREAEMRIQSLCHDMKNHILTIQNLRDTKQDIEVSEYLSRMLKEMKPENQFARTGNQEIDSLLNYKLAEAVATGAEIEAQITLPENLIMDLYDMTIVIGNLMDNALEALSCCQEKRISIVMEYKKDSLFISVKNTYIHILKTSDEIFLSTKPEPEKHGIGLKNVNRVVKKYDGIMAISQENGFFCVDVCLFLE